VDELELIQDIHPGGSNPDEAEEDEEGEGLFGHDMIEDYIGTARLDQYDVADINDDPDVPNLDHKTRALAEAQMARHDRWNARGDGKVFVLGCTRFSFFLLFTCLDVSF